jgi:5-methylcytosine-specific restriction endonuclease McrA
MLTWQVLVLNQTYEPLHFCNMRRAIIMLIKGKAQEVEYDGRVIYSPSFSMRVPTVIRLNRYIKKPYLVGVRFSKKNVFKRDNYTCQYCGSCGLELTIDHVIPKSRGGITSWENVVVACQTCNIRKGDRTLKESGLTLLRKPKKPYFLLHFKNLPQADGSVRASWNKYLFRD